MSKCWICGTDYVTDYCFKCGPPMPWGPTAEELEADDKTERDDFLDDDDD